MKFIKGKLPFVRITALLLSVPQKLRKQVLKANISSVPGKRKTWGLLTYKTHNLGTSIILPSLCQSHRVSLQQTTGQPGWTARFSPLGVDKTGLKSSLEKKKVSTSACITNCWKRQMEGMTGKAIISSGLPFCLDSKEMNIKFHHTLKCYLNMLENVVLLSEI